MLQEAGFTQIDFFGAFPDYKLPSRIICLADGGAKLHAWLKEESPPMDHNGYNGAALDPSFQENLHAMYRSLAADGLAHHFVPSFFVRAS
jgi:hypothetical protein